MKLFLKPIVLGDTYTISKLYLNNVFECHILEDVIRETPNGNTPFEVAFEKVQGKTAIPAGSYDIDITFSNRFKRFLPLLLKVPGFEGIRIHPGNKSEDTEGCLLPGKWTTGKTVSSSVTTFNTLFVKLLEANQRSENITIDISRVLDQKIPT